MCGCGRTTQDGEAETIERFSVVESERNDNLERICGGGESNFERINFKSDLPTREEIVT